MNRPLTYATGWYPWLAQSAHDLSQRPYAYAMVEVCREDWDAPRRVRPSDLAPMMNADGLWWRPCPHEEDV